MNYSRIAILLVFLTPFVAAQKRQPNKPTEPNMPTTPTGEPAEEKFAPEAGVVSPPKPEPAKSPFEGMKYRLVGPFRGGRVLAVAGVPGQADTYYFGAVAGGMWTTRPKPSTSSSINPSPTICSRGCGRQCAGRGPWNPKARAADCIVPPTAATPGPNSRARACPKARSDALGLPLLPTRTGYTR